jgi:hypothetical protein
MICPSARGTCTQWSSNVSVRELSAGETGLRQIQCHSKEFNVIS